MRSLLSVILMLSSVTTLQKAAFLMPRWKADQLLHNEGVDTRREPDQPARPVKILVGTSDQDAECFGS